MMFHSTHFEFQRYFDFALPSDKTVERTLQDDSLNSRNRSRNEMLNKVQNYEDEPGES